MLDQERFHWYRVISFAPLDTEAHKRLETLETRVDQRALIKKAAMEYEDNLKQWSEKLTKVRFNYRNKDKTKRQLAITELRTIDTSDAIPAIEKILSTYSEPLALEALAVIDKIQGQQATDSLVSHALYSDFDAVRVQAAKYLRNRDRFAFLPKMLGAMATPVEFSVISAGVGNLSGVGYSLAQGVIRRSSATPMPRPLLTGACFGLDIRPTEKSLISRPRRWTGCIPRTALISPSGSTRSAVG